jgi:hypothetical protein
MAKSPSLALVCGDDEFAVKQRAKQLYQQWCDELGGMDHEIIDASAKPCKPCRFSVQAKSSGCATAIFSATNGLLPRRPSRKLWANWRRN